MGSSNSFQTERIVINDIEGLRAISHPLRMRVLEELCVAARSVVELAEMLKTTRHRLYYHVRLLKDRGFVVSCGDRSTQTGTEEVFRATAPSFHVSHSLGPSPVLKQTVASMFRQSFADVEAAINSSASGSTARALGATVRLDEERLNKFVVALQELIQEAEGCPDDKAKAHSILIAVAPSS